MSKNMNRHTHIRLSWTVAALVVALVAASAVSLIGHREARAAENQTPHHAIVTASDALTRIESILRDEAKDAQTRIDEALKTLDTMRNEAGGTLTDADPFADTWDPFASSTGEQNDNPFGELSRMRNNMEQMFNDAFSRMNTNMGMGGMGMPSMMSNEPTAWSPQGDFQQTDDAYIYRFDLPGVDKGEVNVTLQDGRLIVDGRRESTVEQTNADNNVARREVQYGQFRRVLTVPADVDLNGSIDSKLDNGVLTVTLPRLKGAKDTASKSIVVK